MRHAPVMRQTPGEGRYLRRPIRSGPDRRPLYIKLILMVIALGGFAMLETRGSHEVMSLQSEIRLRRAQVDTLESRLSYSVMLEGHREGRNAVLGQLGPREGFVTPDSGRVVRVRFAAAGERSGGRTSDVGSG